MRYATVRAQRPSSYRPASSSLEPQPDRRGVAVPALTAFMPIVQAKLRIAGPNDKYEQEADRVADRVMRLPGPTRQCAGLSGSGNLCPECKEERLQRQPNENEASILLRQEVSESENSTAKGGTPSPVPSNFTFSETTIHDADPLPADLRSKLKAYFLITYESKEFYMFTENIPGYDVSEEESIQDEMEYLKGLGYLVVYIERATENDITNAFADPQAAMIFTTGHGDPPGVIRTTNQEFVEPGELTIPPGSNLTQVILGHCHIGDQYEKWKQVLPEDARLTAWTGKTSTRESVQFNSGGGFSDRQWGSLMSRVKSLPQLESQQGQIYRVTEKGETTVIKSWETGEVISE